MSRPELAPPLPIGAGPHDWSRREVARVLAMGAVALGLGGVSRPARAGGTTVSLLTDAEEPTWRPRAAGLVITPASRFRARDGFLEYGREPSIAATLARSTHASPWTVEVAGLVREPRTLRLDELLRLAPVEARTTRHRAVEGWSAVVPWTGLPLAAIVDALEPLPSARYLRFVSHGEPAHMPGMALHPDLPWPYTDALRIDEARHPLAMLALGVYGRPLTPGDGGPIRLVVPWKYAHKGPKSIVRLEFTRTRPSSFWSRALPHEYDFLGNVRPDRPHPRWSQATELRLTDGVHVPTLAFNGYADLVAHLYA